MIIIIEGIKCKDRVKLQKKKESWFNRPTLFFCFVDEMENNFVFYAKTSNVMHKFSFYFIFFLPTH